ncbi:hypothetical protein, partial [Edwardsiella piscicida]|uniref:hypothetical protein n=1 Tax=Edwardsiella piscicida TaxID=1263550 RepID=UPI0011B28273
QRIDGLAGGFSAQGVVSGAVVALRAKNGLETLYAYLALLQLGARSSAKATLSRGSRTSSSAAGSCGFS